MLRWNLILVPKPLTTFDTRIKQPADWIIPSLLARGNTLMMIGEPKRAVKSWLLFNLGWDLALGQNVWGVLDPSGAPLFKPARPMRVLYFTQEDTEDNLQDRFDLMKAAGRVSTPNFFYETKNLGMSFDGGAGEGRIHAAIASCAPLDLIMFDPMRRMHNLDENDSAAMSRFFGALSLLELTFNCSCIVAHHLTKPSKEAAYARNSPHAARGSGDIFGAADSFINVSPKFTRGRPTSTARDVELYYENKRAIATDPMRLTVSFGTGLVSFGGYL